MTGDPTLPPAQNPRREVTFDFSLEDDAGAFAAICFLVIRDGPLFCRRLQGLGKKRIGGVDERMNGVTFYERCSPASATGAPRAPGIVLSTS